MKFDDQGRTLAQNERIVLDGTEQTQMKTMVGVKLTRDRTRNGRMFTFADQPGALLVVDGICLTNAWDSEGAGMESCVRYKPATGTLVRIPPHAFDPAFSQWGLINGPRREGQRIRERATTPILAS